VFQVFVFCIFLTGSQATYFTDSKY